MSNLHDLSLHVYTMVTEQLNIYLATTLDTERNNIINLIKKFAGYAQIVALATAIFNIYGISNKLKDAEPNDIKDIKRRGYYVVGGIVLLIIGLQVLKYILSQMGYNDLNNSL